MTKIAKTVTLAKSAKGKAPIEITAEMVTNGAKLDAALIALDNAKKGAHETALALKAALCPNGKTKGDDGKFLPHIAAFLDQVYATFEGTNAARKMRRMRLVQTIASTTKDALGRTQDAAAKKTRKPRPGSTDKGSEAAGGDTTDGSDNEGDEGNEGEVSKTAERRAAIVGAIASVEADLHALQIGSISRLTGEARKGANVQLDKVRASIKALRGLIG